jgi:hypothetical protein
MQNIFLILLILIVYFSASFVAKKFFCKGQVDHSNWITFNLSIYIEVFLTLIYLFIPALDIYTLATTLPLWYEWIIPIGFIFYFLAKGGMIFSARNNFIKIKDNQLEFKDNTETGLISISSYKFSYGESEAIGKGWMLEIKGEKEKDEVIKKFDLKLMNLNNFKNPIQKTFEKLKIVKH